MTVGDGDENRFTEEGEVANISSKVQSGDPTASKG